MAIDELVKLHAPRWGDPTLAELDWLHRDPEQSRMFMLSLLPMLWTGFRDRYADRFGADVHEAGDALFADLDNYLERGERAVDDRARRLPPRQPAVLDRRVGGTGSVAVVDWQTCTHGPALNDVAYFIGAGPHRRRPPILRAGPGAPLSRRTRRRRRRPTTTGIAAGRTTAAAPGPG